MDAVLDQALALRGVTGVLVLTPDSWLTIASRGALTSTDAPEIEQLLSQTAEDSTGSVPWRSDEGGRCIHFHRTSTHTLILLRVRQQRAPNTRGVASRLSPPTSSSFSSTSTPRAPRMRFGWSTSSRNSKSGSASLFAPSCSVESQNTLRPSSWY